MGSNGHGSLPRIGPRYKLDLYSWQPPYASAVLETDPGKMPSRIAEALKAIEERVRSHGELDEPECAAIEDARTRLAVLKAGRVG
jgi:hypothetical protein